MTNYLFKNLRKSISLPLAIIFNKSILTGKYPRNFKKCTVIPLFKSGDKLLCGNYRPITLSLTYPKSKIFEKCIKVRIVNFLNTKSFFSRKQFGLRTGMSTNDALFEVDSFVRKNIDKYYKVLGIFLDVHKAFDCVNHDILLEKLDRTGIRGVANNLLKSFLSGRTQRVKIDDTFSESLEISCGVPQGTILSPLLFIIFINDLLNIKSKINIELFSFFDDTAILISDPTVNNLYYEANNILNTVYRWF